MERLDVYVVAIGLAPTRSKAQQLIQNGNIKCNGIIIRKNGYKVGKEDVITADNLEILKYVSRGGRKLEKAIDEFLIDLYGKKVLDIGASTGGFTDCALQHGAGAVLAVDVGTSVMDKRLSLNPKVSLFEKTDVRELPIQLLSDIEIIICDVSFISLKSIIPIFDKCKNFDQGVLLIKPQFECGKEIARKYRGVINNLTIHIEILIDLATYIRKCGYQLKGLTYSPIRGGDGNIEYLAWIVRKTSECACVVKFDEVVKDAFSYFEG